MKALNPYRLGLLGVLVVVAVVVTGLAIRSNSDESPTGGDSVAAGTRAEVGSMPTKCAMHMPGDLLAPADAVVHFDTERVCLGYVTVVPSTSVTWANHGDSAHRLTVLTLDGSKTVFDESVPSGESVTRRFGEGLYLYRTDAIPSFTGTIEVVDSAA